MEYRRVWMEIDDIDSEQGRVRSTSADEIWNCRSGCVPRARGNHDPSRGRECHPSTTLLLHKGETTLHKDSNSAIRPYLQPLFR